MLNLKLLHLCLLHYFSVMCVTMMMLCICVPIFFKSINQFYLESSQVWSHFRSSMKSIKCDWSLSHSSDRLCLLHHIHFICIYACHILSILIYIILYINIILKEY